MIVPPHVVSRVLFGAAVILTSCNSDSADSSRQAFKQRPVGVAAGPIAEPAERSNVVSESKDTAETTCVEGRIRCSGNVPARCVEGHLTPIPITIGLCGAECTPSSTRCRGIRTQTCSSDGHWRNGQECNRSQVCRNGTCTRWRPAKRPPPTGSDKKSESPEIVRF
jgi:hypothetical protein